MSAVNWEPTWNALLQGSVFDLLGVKRKRQLVDWARVVNAWRHISDSPAKPFEEVLGNRPMFVTDIDLPFGGGYSMVWDVQKAVDFLHSLDQPQVLMPIRTLFQAVRLGSQRTLIHTSPIIVAEYPLIQQRFLIIDGNHRVAAAHQRSPFGEIRVTILPQMQMYQSLLDNRSRRNYDQHEAIGNWLFWETQEQGESNVPIPAEFRLG